MSGPVKTRPSRTRPLLWSNRSAPHRALDRLRPRFVASAATSVAFMRSAAIDAMISVSIAFYLHIYIYMHIENSIYIYIYLYIHIYVIEISNVHLFRFSFEKKSLPVHRPETGISGACPCVHDRRFMRRMAGITKSRTPPQSHRGDEDYGVRPPTLGAWLQRHDAQTSGAD